MGYKKIMDTEINLVVLKDDQGSVRQDISVSVPAKNKKVRCLETLNEGGD